MKEKMLWRKIKRIVSSVLLAQTCLLMVACKSKDNIIQDSSLNDISWTEDISKNGGAYSNLYDNAGLLNEDQRRTVEEKLKEKSARRNTDFIIVTTNSLNGKSIEEYTEDFYEQQINQGGDVYGVILCLSMEDRNAYIYSNGGLNDDSIDRLFPSFIDSLRSDNYYVGFLEFIDAADLELMKVRAGLYDTSKTPETSGHICVFDQKNTHKRYECETANCSHGTGYHYSCVCGGYDIYGEIFYDSDVDPNEHQYNQKNTDSQYLATPATYGSPAKYYYSCVCGKRAGSSSFEYGEPKEIPIILNIPQAPFAFYNYSNPAYFVHTSTVIEEISYEFETSKWSSGVTVKLKIRGTKTDCMSDGLQQVQMGVRITDPEGLEICYSVLASNYCKVGEKFEFKYANFYIPGDKVVAGEYKVTCIPIRW